MLKKYGVSLVILFISFSYIVGLDFSRKLSILDITTLAITVITIFLAIYGLYLKARKN